MTIDWTELTPWSALAGGLLIGAAASLLLVLNGRIAGVSSILGGLLSPTRGDIAWRLAFIGGLALSPMAWWLVSVLPSPQIDASYPALALAGLLVGMGTRYGGGCTSGHGVCGVSRLSPRSLIATLCFMATGISTVLVLRHLLHHPVGL